MVLKLCNVPEEIEDAQPAAYKETKAAARTDQVVFGRN